MTILLGLFVITINKVYGGSEVPSDIPYEYDPNQCLSPIMDWVVTYPGVSNVYSVHSRSKYGTKVNLYVTGTEVVIQQLEKLRDSEGYWNQYFNFSFSLPEGVHYINMTATDIAGRTDSRTLLVLAVENDPPYLYPGGPPVSINSIKSAQKLVQVAKKQNKELTKPTRVLN